MEAGETPPPPRRPRGRLRPATAGEGYRAPADGIWTLGGRLSWVAGLVLMLSPFMSWYAGDNAGDGLSVQVTGWHTGTLGKLVFFLGLALLLLAALREAGIVLPAALPESLIVLAIGSLATIFVLIRLLSIPDEFFFASRSVGIWIALAAAIAVILAGLLQASEEL